MRRRARRRPRRPTACDKPDAVRCRHRRADPAVRRRCRSSPNQATTSATCSRFGQSICNSSSDAARSLPCVQHVPVHRLGLARPLLPRHQRRRQPVLRRAGDQRDRADLLRAARRPAAAPRTGTAECGCRSRPAESARTRHRPCRDRPACCPRPAWPRSADRRPASSPPRWTRSSTVSGRSRARRPRSAGCRRSRPRRARRRHWRNSCIR